MTENDKLATGDDGLEAYFEAARADTPVPSTELLGRIMADAATQSAARDDSLRQVTVLRQGIFSSLIEAIGGWPTLAGMATAGVVGVWIGFSQPAGLDTVAEQLIGADNTSYLVDLVPAFGSEFEEG